MLVSASHRRYRPQDPLTTGTLVPCDLLVSCVEALAQKRSAQVASPL